MCERKGKGIRIATGIGVLCYRVKSISHRQGECADTDMPSDARQIETQTQVHRLTDTEAYNTHNTHTATTQRQHTHIGRQEVSSIRIAICEKPKSLFFLLAA